VTIDLDIHSPRLAAGDSHSRLRRWVPAPSFRCASPLRSCFAALL